MCEIDDICKKHGVRYYFSEGTALGLYRSGDLIDWDDDVDIAMEEDQYNRFLKKCLPELVNRGYYLLYSYSHCIKKELLAFLKNGQLIDVENIKINEKCI
jgi:phosphorylcholine metabolism protein LicD